MCGDSSNNQIPTFPPCRETWVGGGGSFIDGGDVSLLDEGQGWEGTGGVIGKIEPLFLILSRIGWR